MRERLNQQQSETEKDERSALLKGLQETSEKILSLFTNPETAKIITEGIFSRDTKAFYNREAEKYNSDFGGDLKIAEEIAKKFLPGGAKALDLACGTGLTAFPLRKKYEEVFGIDISEGMLAKANEAIQRAKAEIENLNIFLIQGNMTALPFRDGIFDALQCIGAIWHLQKGEEDAFAHEAFRILKENGGDRRNCASRQR